MNIRLETPADHSAIRNITDEAFKGAAHSSGTEGAIVEKLREAGSLTVSLVAERDSEIVGHVAFSPVAIGNDREGWFGLGPVSVIPDLQRKGIGGALIEDGLSRLRTLGAKGCVVLGDPEYYGRFGFKPQPGVNFEGAPPEYFTILVFGEASASGSAVYHSAFYEN